MLAQCLKQEHMSAIAMLQHNWFAVINSITMGETSSLILTVLQPNCVIPGLGNLASLIAKPAYSELGLRSDPAISSYSRQPGAYLCPSLSNQSVSRHLAKAHNHVVTLPLTINDLYNEYFSRCVVELTFAKGWTSFALHRTSSRLTFKTS
jgi:hypothetical protein